MSHTTSLHLLPGAQIPGAEFWIADGRLASRDGDVAVLVQGPSAIRTQEHNARSTDTTGLTALHRTELFPLAAPACGARTHRYSVRHSILVVGSQTIGDGAFAALQAATCLRHWTIFASDPLAAALSFALPTTAVIPLQVGSKLRQMEIATMIRSKLVGCFIDAEREEAAPFLAESLPEQAGRLLALLVADARAASKDLL